jgi:hypothetical protein
MFQILEDLELQQCLGFLSGGILLHFNLWRTIELHPCRGFFVLSAIHSCRNLKFWSSLLRCMVVMTLVVVASPVFIDFLQALVLGQ